jgi:hypothetical protein
MGNIFQTSHTLVLKTVNSNMQDVTMLYEDGTEFDQIE